MSEQFGWLCILYFARWFTEVVPCRYVSCLLTPEQMAHRVALCNELHMRFHGEGDAEFCNVITVYESGMFHYNPESKQQNSRWKTSTSSVPKEANIVRSAEKVIMIIFTVLLLGHSRSAHLFGMFFWYQWRYLLVSCIRNITPGGRDARVVGTNRRRKWTVYASEITKNTLKTIYYWQYYPI